MTEASALSSDRTETSRSGSGYAATFERRAAVRGYTGLGGHLGELAASSAEHRPVRQGLTLVHATAPATPGRFPDGVEARIVDDCGRLRPNLRAGSTADVLGWQAGVLDTTIVDGWLTLTQRPEHVGAPRGRTGNLVGFTVTGRGVERVCLRPAHLLALDATAGTLLLVAAIPDSAALVVVNPMQLAGHAPAHVRTLLGIEPSRHLHAVEPAADPTTQHHHRGAM